MTGSSSIGLNLFAYCLNDPVNMADTSGTFPFFAITAAIGAVVGAVVGGVVAAANGKNVWAGVAIGAAAGGLIGLGAGAVASTMIAGYATASAGYVLAGTSIGNTIAAIEVGISTAATSVEAGLSYAEQVLWAGGEQTAGRAAETFANLSQTGTVIANSPIGQETIAATRNLPWEQARPLWEAASESFVSEASGYVHVFINLNQYSPSSIFATVELPSLISNPDFQGFIITILGD